MDDNVERLTLFWNGILGVWWMFVVLEPKEGWVVTTGVAQGMVVIIVTWDTPKSCFVRTPHTPLPPMY